MTVTLSNLGTLLVVGDDLDAGKHVFQQFSDYLNGYPVWTMNNPTQYLYRAADGVWHVDDSKDSTAADSVSFGSGEDPLGLISS